MIKHTTFFPILITCISIHSQTKEFNDLKKLSLQQSDSSVRLCTPLSHSDFKKASDDPDFGYYYALIIGIDDYRGKWSKFKNAVYDAQSIEEVLEKKYKIDHFKTFYNSEATKENIMSEFEWLMDNLKDHDNLLIYYSGHGFYNEKLNRCYWVPADAEGELTSENISCSDIQTSFGKIKSKHILLISDDCFPGDIFEENTMSVPFEDCLKYYVNLNKLISRQALTSGGIEPLMDDGREGHSVFCYYLLKELNDNTSKYLDAKQLFEFIKIHVINNSNQTPSLTSVKNTGNEGPQFIFILK